MCSAAGLSLQLDATTDFEERRMIRAALRDLLKKKRGKDLSPHSRFFMIPLMLCVLKPPRRVSSDKREQERGSRQQDLKEQGLSRGGKTGGATTMNQPPLTKSTFRVTSCWDILWFHSNHVNSFDYLLLVRAARSAVCSSSQVS